MLKKVSQKMGIQPGVRAILVDAPVEAVESIDLPDVEISSELKGDFNYIHLFVTKQSELQEQFPKLKSHLLSGGMLWVSWPKGGQLETDLNLKILIKIGYDFGLVESTALSINAVWSGLKFTHPKKGKVYHNSYGQLKPGE